MRSKLEPNEYNGIVGKKVKLVSIDAVDINQLPNQINLAANTKSLPSFCFDMMDGLPVEEQPTLLLPVIQDLKEATEAAPQEAGMAGYADQLRTLIKSSGIYALASLASPLVSLVLAPFLTRHLSHEDYGALAVISTTVALLAGLTQLGLASAFFRSYNYDYVSRSDRLGVLSTVIVLLSLVSIPIALVIIITAPWLAILLLRDSSFSDVVRLGALVALIQNLTIPGFAWLRAENRVALFTTLSIINLLVNLGTTLVLVGILHMGIAGSLIGIGSGFAVVVICTLPLILLRTGVRLRFDIARGLLSFGIPNVFSFVSVWVLQLSDRYLLSLFGSLAQTASYAVAYSLGGILNAIVLAPFTLAWASAAYAIAKRDDAPRIFRLVFSWYSIVLLFATFALSLVSTIILDLFFPSTYRSAAPIIPIIALSAMFYGVYNIFAVGTAIKRKTWLLVVFTTVAALVNVGLNLVLIPLFGAMGAAASTLLAYAILALIAYIVNQWIYPIPFEIGKFIVALLLGIVLYLGSNFLAQSQPRYTSWGISFGALVLYGGCLVLLGILSTPGNNNTSRQAKGAFSVMKAFISTDALVTKEAGTLQLPVKVCMHVRGVSRTDVRVMREATILAEAGFSVSIIDIECDATRPAEEDIRGIHVKHMLRPDWLIPPRFKLWRPVRTMQKLIGSTFHLIRTPADIYHAHDANALLPCYIAAQVRRRLLIFDAHEMPLHELEDTRWRWTRALITQLFVTVVRRCAGVITVSPPIISELYSRYHIADVSLIRNILPYQVVPRSDRLRQHLGLSSNVRIVLYSGNFQPNRTLDKLIRAAKFLERDIVIVLMGRSVGSTQAELEALVTREGVADRVKIIPPVPYQALLDWTASADVGAIVYAPDHSINARVQFPNKLFEYLMAGLPVIASQLPAIAEIIETYDVGRVLASLEPADIGAEINAMLADRAGLERMQRNALEACQRDLNWAKESQLLLRLYHNILLKQNEERNGLKTFPHTGATHPLEGEPDAHSLR